ncbi:hypothetical protein QS306_08400 [Paraburkholderia bonniea]|uniref:hypothetical protein n=1 Tax=Paraburkholderia bonniea TaxID=2152891 RepID=UPI002573A7EC|nr:hypothetical protein [Paraburkholderia bonniea]WJF89161.1 hypothetical protein QS306_08400 [Paraburkholderia bonniea]WJF92477.1 hypothetical protein QS308_08410 [Paraburkholderia bonniea]
MKISNNFSLIPISYGTIPASKNYNSISDNSETISVNNENRKTWQVSVKQNEKRAANISGSLKLILGVCLIAKICLTSPPDGDSGIEMTGRVANYAINLVMVWAALHCGFSGVKHLREAAKINPYNEENQPLVHEKEKNQPPV